VVVDIGALIKKWTDLLFTCNNIRNITVSPDHAAAHGVMECGHTLLADALSNLTAGSDTLKEMWVNHLPAVRWAHNMTVRDKTGYSPFHQMFS
jgi:hypothetical protein